MRDLVHAYISRGLDRRGFLKGMAASGFTVAAAESVLTALAPMVSAQEMAAAKLRTMEGTGSKLLLEQLKAAGVKHVFYGNGTGSASMLDAMADDNDISLILGPEENIVTAMASGYAMASNEPAFVNVSGTVGTAHQMLNMFNAKKDNVPLIVSAYTEGTGGTGRDGFESVDDLVEITKQFTRWGFEISQASRTPEMIRNAIRISTTPPGGPTYLSIPSDVGSNLGKADIYSKEFFTVPIRTRPDPRLIEKAAKMLLEAKKPFMYVGHEVWRSDGYDEMVKLAELVGLQVVQGFSPYTDFPTNHALYAGNETAGFGGLRSLRDADVMLVMGSKMPYQMGPTPPIPKEWKIIEVRSVPNDVARHVATDIPIVAEVKATAQALIEAISSSMTAAHRETAKQRREEAAAFSKRVRDSREQFAAQRKDSVPISWERVAQEANLALEDDAIITHEFGSATPRVLPWLELAKGKKELCGRTIGSGLGWSVGAAVGIKMAKPNRQVVDFLGDGAFLMGQVEALWAAKRFETPVLYVVLNNRSYNDTRLRQTALAPRLQELKRDLGNYLGNPDVSFEQIARGFEVAGATVDHPGQIADALKRGVSELKEGRPFVIDVVAERTGVLADSTWYPKYSVAEQRTRQV